MLLILLSLTQEASAVPLQLTQQGRMLDANGIGIQGLELVAFGVLRIPAAATCPGTNPIQMKPTMLPSNQNLLGAHL